MKSYKNYLFIFLFLGQEKLFGAAAQEYYHPLLNLVDAVQQATDLPDSICEKLIVPYHGECAYPDLKMVAKRSILMIPMCMDVFVRHLRDGRMLIMGIEVKKEGELWRGSACFNNDKHNTVSHVIRSQLQAEVKHVELLDDDRLVLADADGNLEITHVEDPRDSRIIASGNKEIVGLANLPSRNELAVAGSSGLFIFDTTTWKSTRLHSKEIDTVTSVFSEKVAFRDSRSSTVYVYNPQNKPIEDTGLSLFNGPAQRLLTACGRNLLAMDLPDHAMPIRAAVGLSHYAAVLQGSVCDGRAKSAVTIIGEDGQIKQTLPQEDVVGIFPAQDGLSTIALDQSGDIITSLWRPQSVQDLRGQKRKMIQQKTSENARAQKKRKNESSPHALQEQLILDSCMRELGELPHYLSGH